jgi:hypothetical protein
LPSDAEIIPTSAGLLHWTRQYLIMFLVEISLKCHVLHSVYAFALVSQDNRSSNANITR